MKKLLSLFITLALSLSLAFSASVTAFAENNHYTLPDGEERYITPEWTRISGETGMDQYGKSKFYVDTKNYYDDSRYSIKLVNEDYNVSYVEKTFEVEPYTDYKFSAWVKYSDYKLEPTSESKESGACIGKAYSWELSEFSKSKKWTKVEYSFKTGNETRYNLCLQNGMWGGAKCKGTAYFSDVKLEKAKTTNKWNVLTVIFKNVDVKIDLHDKTTRVKPEGKGLTRYTDSISSSGIKEIKEITEKLYSSMEELSGGLMDIKDIDFVTVDDTVTELTNYDYDGDKWGTGAIHGYQIDLNCELVSKVLDEQLAKKQYHQIIVYSPLYGIAGGWMGNGGGDYKGVNFCQLHSLDIFYNENSEFSEGGIVHEILHCLERDTRVTYDPDMPSLHAAPDFGHLNGGKEWYSAYMRAELKGGKGIDKRTYYYPSGKYTLVDNDMTFGEGIVFSESSRIDISECKAAKISDKTYSGKKKNPSLTITDGKYTLKKGIDYTVKYSNNKNVGTAKVTVTGKGIYKGTLTTTFKIVPKQPSVKLKKSGSNLKLSWSEVKGASKYIIWQRKDGGNFEKIAETDAETFSKKIKYSSKHTYQFALTAYIPDANIYTSYVYTDVI